MRKGVKSGRLSRSIRRGKVVDAELAAREWKAGATKPPNKGGAAVAPAPEGAPPPQSPPAAGETPAPVGGTLVSAQLQVARARATQIRILNRQRSGRLIDAEVARREAYESARSIRDAVLAVPDRVAAELAAESDAGRVHARLREELRAALAGVAEALARGA